MNYNISSRHLFFIYKNELNDKLTNEPIKVANAAPNKPNGEIKTIFIITFVVTPKLLIISIVF